MEHKDEMIFVKWTRNAPHRYKLIVSIENKRGSLASFLFYLAKMQINLVTIELGKSEDGHVDYFELVIELPEGADSTHMRESIKMRYKLIEFISLNDAYKK